MHEFGMKLEYVSNGRLPRTYTNISTCRISYKKLQSFMNLCETQVESLQHLLIECDHAKRIWLEMNVNVSGMQSQHIEIISWISSWFTSTQTDFEENQLWISRLMCTSWHIWKNRCAKVFNTNVLNCRLICSYITQMVNQCMLEVSSQSKLQTEETPPEWCPPSFNSFKINMDASFDYNNKDVGIGLILRDHAGTTRAIRGRYSNGGLDPEQAECWAMKQAVLWANELNLRSVIFESDCKNEITSISDVKPTVHWMNQGYIDEIRHLLKNFMFSEVSHVKRLANNIAHVIAIDARARKSSFDFECNIPKPYENLVRGERKVNKKLCNIIG
ncbi:uncharacterized protein LOC113351800 [Papaver somniferum]|uniref:uncharacterized protein LOC113351800 n=1 Tax=Papaver somniferum TaxID=3469 RepID=UPI000E6FEF5B|nr:uncharacterized protein LOC113351800 [Papaver somniferum]